MMIYVKLIKELNDLLKRINEPPAARGTFKLIYQVSEIDFPLYVKKLYLTKCEAAFHVLILLAADESQNYKPYMVTCVGYCYHRRWFSRLSHFYSIVNGNSSEYLKAELPQPKVYNYNLRSEGVFERSNV